MNILLISRGYPSVKDPQWGCFEKDQAEALVAVGHKVIVISVDSRFRMYWRKLGISHYILNGIDYYDSFLIPGETINKLFGKKIGLFIKRMQLNRLFNRVIQKHGRPDVIYSHYLPNSYIVISLKKMYNLPLIAIEHWSQLNKDILSDHVVWLGQSTYSKCDAIISVSESLRQRLLQHFQMDSTVVHNMVGTEFCRSYSKERLDGKVRFVSTGSLFYGKGYDLLITAFDRIKLPLNKWELTIIGEGEERVNLERQIERAGLRNNVHLLGRKGKTEISAILCNSDVFVLPSRAENFSVAVLEALCEGLPVVASICGGIRECINISNGLLFPVDDLDSLVGVIKKIYECHNRYDREKIATDSRARFSPNVIASQLTNVFQRVIENRI